MEFIENREMLEYFFYPQEYKTKEAPFMMVVYVNEEKVRFVLNMSSSQSTIGKKLWHDMGEPPISKEGFKTEDQYIGACMMLVTCRGETKGVYFLVAKREHELGTIGFSLISEFGMTSASIAHLRGQIELHITAVLPQPGCRCTVSVLIDEKHEVEFVLSTTSMISTITPVTWEKINRPRRYKWNPDVVSIDVTAAYGDKERNMSIAVSSVWEENFIGVDFIVAFGKFFEATSFDELCQRDTAPKLKISTEITDPRQHCVVPTIINKQAVHLLVDTSSRLSSLSPDTWESIGKPEVFEATEEGLKDTGYHINNVRQVMVSAKYENIAKLVRILFVQWRRGYNIFGTDLVDQFSIPLSHLCAENKMSTLEITTDILISGKPSSADEVIGPLYTVPTLFNNALVEFVITTTYDGTYLTVKTWHDIGRVPTRDDGFFTVHATCQGVTEEKIFVQVTPESDKNYIGINLVEKFDLLQNIKKLQESSGELALKMTPNDQKDPPFVMCALINNVHVDFKVDLGASHTLVSKDIWREIGEPKLSTIRMDMTTFENHAWPITEMCNVDVKYKGEKVEQLELLFHQHPINILGRNFIESLDLFAVNVPDLCAVRYGDSNPPVLEITTTARKPDEEPIVKISMDGEIFDFLFDTGSTSTLIGAETWQKIGNKLSLRETSLKKKDAYGNEISFLGEVTLTVTYEGRTKDMSALVFSKHNKNVLGRDWIYAFNNIHKLSFDEMMKRCSTIMVQTKSSTSIKDGDDEKDGSARTLQRNAA